MKHETVDIVVIGAGIQGVGIAQALALQGHQVAIIEKNAVAGLETSSKSSKLIHGGLRYLETAQFSLVIECLQERKRLLANAPHLVKLVPFYIPSYQGSSRHPLWIQLGLWCYRLLSLGQTSIQTHVPLDRAKTLQLSRLGLQNIACYYDAQTDDHALTQAVLNSAKSFGAKIFYDHSVCSISLHNNGATIKTQQTQFDCQYVVNAGGPWMTDVLARCTPSQTPPCVELIKGSHIICDRPSPKGCFYLESPDDARPLFVLPWKGKMMIGTNEIRQPKNCFSTECSDDEVDYFLRTYNHYFVDTPLTKTDVLSRLSGLRVLPEQGVNANAKHRDTIECCDSQFKRLYSIAGGKLTAYRASSEKIAKKIHTKLTPLRPYKSTKNTRLPER